MRILNTAQAIELMEARLQDIQAAAHELETIPNVVTNVSPTTWANVTDVISTTTDVQVTDGVPAIAERVVYIKQFRGSFGKYLFARSEEFKK